MFKRIHEDVLVKIFGVIFGDIFEGKVVNSPEGFVGGIVERFLGGTTDTLVEKTFWEFEGEIPLGEFRTNLWGFFVGFVGRIIGRIISL